MTEQLLKQLQFNLNFIENIENYFSMFNRVIDSCTIAQTVNSLLHDLEALSDNDFVANANHIQKTKQRAIKIHSEWVIRELERSKTKHTVRTFVSTLYSDIFGNDLK